MLKVNGRLITSQRAITEELAKHFNKKVAKMRAEFIGNGENAMRILEQLCPCKSDNFKFTKINLIKMYETIQAEKPSKTTSEDNLSMDIVEQIPKSIAEVMTHLVNRMFETGKFLEGFKRARIIPL